MTPSPTVVRPYRGVSPADRAAYRRTQLMDAGLEVFAADGYANSSVRRICEVAGLNQRYFYESFETREDCLSAVYEEIIQSTRSAMVDAVLATEGNDELVRAGIDAWWRAATADRRCAQVLAIEIVGVSERMEKRRREIRHSFADFIVAQAAAAAGSEPRVSTGLDPVVIGRALVAAMIELLIDWLRGEIAHDVDGLIDQSTRLFLSTAAALYPGAFYPAAG